MGTFVIPNKLTPVNSINCAKHIVNSSARKEFIYDFSNMQHCHPFGLLLVGSAIRSNRHHYRKARHNIKWDENLQGNNFAADFGFFQYAGWDVGRKYGSMDYGVSYIPIKKITIKELQAQNPDILVLGDMIDRHALDLAYTLTQSKTSEATKTLQYCLREMIRNTFEHGNTEEIWICGQYWAGRNEAEIALLDEGRGIYNSLASNRRYTLSSHQAANKLALQPGASRMFGKKQDPNDGWQNSGYGLFMASALCSMGGYFILGSGQDATLINSDNQCNYDANIRGTAVCMNLRTDKINNLQTQLDRLVQLGEQKAKEHSAHRILTASKVSTIASLIHKDINK